MLKQGVVYILLIIMLFTSCNIQRNNSIKLPPSIEQINDFIVDESINVIAIKEASNFTVLLYQNETSYGHYVLYVDQNDQLVSSNLNATGTMEKNVLLGGIATGSTPFVTIIINDDFLLQKANKIRVTFEDDTDFLESINDKGIIVLYHNQENKESVSYKEIIIYDENLSILYEQFN